MTAEDWFSVFDEKYGDDFNWTMIPFSNHYFIEELKKNQVTKRMTKQSPQQQNASPKMTFCFCLMVNIGYII